MFFGLVMVALSARHFEKAGTTIKPFEESTHLVVTGFYRHTRNPMYLGGVLILTGVAFMLGSLSPFLAIPVFVWLIQRNFIRAEEEMLQAAFGDAYADYKSRVRRWI